MFVCVCASCIWFSSSSLSISLDFLASRTIFHACYHNPSSTLYWLISISSCRVRLLSAKKKNTIIFNPILFVSDRLLFKKNFPQLNRNEREMKNERWPRTHTPGMGQTIYKIFDGLEPILPIILLTGRIKSERTSKTATKTHRKQHSKKKNQIHLRLLQVLPGQKKTIDRIII